MIEKILNKENVIAFILFVGIALPLPADVNEDLQRIENNIPPLNYRIIKPEIVSIGDSGKLYYLKDDEFPVINFRMIIRRGSLHDDSDKAGLADLFARVWRRSGSKQENGSALDSYFEFIGGSLKINFDRQYGYISIQVLKKDFPDAIKKMQHLVSAPDFNASALSFEKDLALDKLQRTLDNPIQAAFRNFRHLYFQDHPYGAVVTKESIQKISLEDIRQFYRETLHAANMDWVVVGDIDLREAKTIVQNFPMPAGNGRKNFAGMDLSLKNDQNKTQGKTEIVIIDKNIPQSTIIIGGKGIRFRHEKRTDMQLLNFLLGGGGFNSRLMREIRSNRGLAYSTGSLTRSYRDFGLFLAYAQTKTESTAEVIRIMKEEISRMSKEDVGKDELIWAKESLSNKFVFQFSDYFSVVMQSYDLDYNRASGDYLSTYLKRLQGVTPDSIRQIAKAVLHLEKFPVVVVGPASRLKKELAKLGSVRVIKAGEK